MSERVVEDAVCPVCGSSDTIIELFIPDSEHRIDILEDFDMPVGTLRVSLDWECGDCGATWRQHLAASILSGQYGIEDGDGKQIGDKQQEEL